MTLLFRYITPSYVALASDIILTGQPKNNVALPLHGLIDNSNPDFGNFSLVGTRQKTALFGKYAISWAGNAETALDVLETLHNLHVIGELREEDVFRETQRACNFPQEKLAHFFVDIIDGNKHHSFSTSKDIQWNGDGTIVAMGSGADELFKAEISLPYSTPKTTFCPEDAYVQRSICLARVGDLLTRENSQSSSVSGGFGGAYEITERVRAGGEFQWRKADDITYALWYAHRQHNASFILGNTPEILLTPRYLGDVLIADCLITTSNGQPTRNLVGVSPSYRNISNSEASDLTSKLFSRENSLRMDKPWLCVVVIACDGKKRKIASKVEVSYRPSPEKNSIFSVHHNAGENRYDWKIEKEWLRNTIRELNDSFDNHSF